jgi:hypothetical protein
MNAKTVLKRLVSLLQAEEVQLTYAKLADGTIVESPTFDVGEPLEVVSEDGTKTPAPDGEHELTLKDSEGNENIIKVITKDGVIAERENVELADEETKEAEEIPAEGTKEIPTEMAEETIETEEGDIPSTGDGIPAEEEEEDETEIEISLKEMCEKLSYRIEELEKKIASFEEVKEEVVDKEPTMEEDEEELPKLDGAPVEASVKKFSSIKSESKGTRVLSTHDRVLARLYKK